MQKQSSMSLWDKILLWAKRSLTFQKCKPQCRNPNSIHQHHLYYQLFTFQIFFHFSSTPCSQDNKILRKMLFMFWSFLSQNDPSPPPPCSSLMLFMPPEKQNRFIRLGATWQCLAISLSGNLKAHPRETACASLNLTRWSHSVNSVSFGSISPVTSHFWGAQLPQLACASVEDLTSHSSIHPFTHSQIYIMLTDCSLYNIPEKSFWYCPSFNFYFLDYSASHWGYYKDMLTENMERNMR